MASRVRYLWPNLATLTGLAFAVIAVERAILGRPVDAAWWGLLVVVTDKLDGFLAKRLDAGSAFGVQLDSLVDLIAFGVVPAAVAYALFATRPALGWADLGGGVPLQAVCVLFVAAAAARLARFNVLAASGPQPHYTGVPSTMTAGILLSGLLAILKYADPGHAAPEVLAGPDLLPRGFADGALRAYPVVLLVGGAAMLSPLRVPRLGRTFSRVTDALLGLALALGLGFGLARRLPEYLCAGGLWYLGICVAYHLRTRQRRGV